MAKRTKKAPAHSRKRQQQLAAARRVAELAETRSRRVLGTVGIVLLCLIFFALLAGLRVVGVASEPRGATSLAYTPKVAVVGVGNRTDLRPIDTELLNSQPAEVGAIRTNGCVNSGWATLSAGTPVEVACSISVTSLGVVEDWRARQAEAQRSGGTLGTLADSGAECVAAVGSGAVLGAAKSDGTTAFYNDVETFISDGYQSPCLVTMIDAGVTSDQIITALSQDPEWTVIVVGLGTANDQNPQSQLIYRLGTTLPGWLTSDSTQRTGVVTLPDLSRSLAAMLSGETAPDSGLKVVDNGGVSPTRLAEHLQQIDRLVRVPLGPLVATGVLLLAGVVALPLLRRSSRRWSGAVVGWAEALVATGPVGVLGGGAFTWWRSLAPEAAWVGETVAAWVIAAVAVRGVIAVAASRGRHWAALPVASLLTLGVMAADAAVNGFLHRSSLVALRPMTHYVGFDGPAVVLVIAAGGAMVAWQLSGLPRRSDGEAAPAGDGDDDDSVVKVPVDVTDVVNRIVVAVSVVVAVVLAVIWAGHPPTGWDVLAGAGVALWVALIGWLVRPAAPA